MLSETQRELRWQMEIVAYTGIHAIKYFNGVTGNGNEFWKFTQNCYGERACHLWCQLFNSYYKDPTHYKNLFGEKELENLGSSFNYSNVKKRIIKSTGLNEKEYMVFRESLINFRNKYSAHREFENDNILFPNLDIALLMFYELRDIIFETVKSELNKCDDTDVKDFHNYYKYNSKNDIVRKCKNDISQIRFF